QQQTSRAFSNVSFHGQERSGSEVSPTGPNVSVSINSRRTNHFRPLRRSFASPLLVSTMRRRRVNHLWPRCNSCLPARLCDLGGRVIDGPAELRDITLPTRGTHGRAASEMALPNVA